MISIPTSVCTLFPPSRNASSVRAVASARASTRLTVAVILADSVQTS